MNRFEQQPTLAAQEIDFGMDFDINAAFQNALSSVGNDQELALDEKIRRMETIVSEGNSETYRSFIDFRQMAAQMEMMCSHDHAMNDAMKGNESLTSFRDSHNDAEHGHKHDDDEETKSGKKKKKKRGWFGVYR